jgi:hypothetical protein
MVTLIHTEYTKRKEKRKGKKIKTGKKFWGEVGTFGGISPQKMPRINTELTEVTSHQTDSVNCRPLTETVN